MKKKSIFWPTERVAGKAFNVVIINIFSFMCECTCRNPSLGLTTKVKTCKGVGQEGSLGVTSHAPGSVGKCEEMNLHTPKATPTLGGGVLVESRIFKEKLQRSKPNGLRNSLYH